MATKPASNREDALAVVRRLREAGHVAYFAGGCVRDALLGLEPKDYDVATDAPPEKVRQLFRRTQAVGAAFGVILVREKSSQIEVATFRKDLKYVDGRRPEGVVFSNAEEDAKRRDFTINGLFFDPIENKVIDFIGGQEDLKAKTLRAIGNPNERFSEDYLRLLRAVRFASRFGLTIESETASAIIQHAEHLKRISPERVADELRAMLTPAYTRVAAWGWLWKFGLLQVIFRALPERPTRPVPAEKYSKPLFPELAPGHSAQFGLSLAALTVCYRLGARYSGSYLSLLEDPEVSRSVQACRTTLKISNHESDVMAGAIKVGHLLRDEPPSIATMKRFLATSTSGQARLLLTALRRSDASLTRIDWLAGQFAKLEAEGEVAPAPVLTGDDLTIAGFKPGPMFKRILDEVYDAQLEGRVTTRDEAIQMARRIADEGT